MAPENLKKVSDLVWELPQDNEMRVPGRIFVSKTLLDKVEGDTYGQVANVATLPGIQKYSMAMPDVHLGYGFPIGGVAAFNQEEGIISPGGVGFDINCGVRLITTNLTRSETQPKVKPLIEQLFKNVPSGVGSRSKLRVDHQQLDEVFSQGARWAVEQGYGTQSDLEHCEENGCMKAADPSKVWEKAHERGRSQLGTLGSGNHFLEIQHVDQIYDEKAAQTFGLQKDQIVVMVHCGSRGAGHQICSDYLKVLEKATRKYNIKLRDRQLVCAPITSQEGQDYFAAMSCAANYAWANRQVITHWVRETLNKFFQTELELKLVYDVCHNIAKQETHQIDGKDMKVCVHRKGATRAFAPHHPDVPSDYQETGQPIIIPGSMGTASYMLHGTQEAMELTFGSTCHGAGRMMSRTRAKKQFYGENVRKDLMDKGIYVKAVSGAMIAEEAPGVYKSSDEVVEVVDQLGISKKVARLLPMGVAKG